MSSWFDDLRKSIIDSLKSDIKQATLSGLEEPLEKASSENSEAVGRKALLLDPFYENTSANYYLTRGKLSRISNKTLKDISVRDWLVSAIIQVRVDTLLRFSKPTHDRFKMGYRFSRRDGEQLTQEDRENISFLENFVYNCGRTDNLPPGDNMNFGEFLKLVVRDALTFGYIGVEKVLTRSQSLHRFRPIPAETLYRVNPQNSKQVVEQTEENARAVYHRKKSDNDPKSEGVIYPRDIDYYKYVQVTSDGNPIAVFGDEDLIFKLANAQNFADSNGYCISVVEQAVIMITSHLNVENYNCYLPGYGRIQMADGSINLIENVDKDQQVVSHTGRHRRILKTMNRHYSGQVINIKPMGMLAHKVTPEHPFLVIDRLDHRNNKRGALKDPSPQWREAKDLHHKDLVLIPKVRSDNSKLIIDLSKLADSVIDGKAVVDNRISKYRNQPWDLDLEIDEEWGWFLGLYAGDGCLHSGVDGHVVRIDLGSHEQRYADRIKELMLRYGVMTTTSTHSVSNKCLQVYVHSKMVARICNLLIPGLSETKSINPILTNAPASVRTAFICGHIDADGTVSNAGDAVASTVSANLAIGIANICNSLGFLLKVTNEYMMYYPRGSLTSLGVSELKGRKLANISRHSFYHDCGDYFGVRVSYLQSEHYEGPVYNIEVEEDNSYLCNMIATHNCNYFTHGYASKGILHLKGTVTQNALAAFRRQFYNTISGTQNAWRTPIVAGLDDVQWVPMSGSAREMEYINFNSHLMRAICAQFQIDPIEVGLDYLTSANGRAASSAKESGQFKITYSRERGLIPLMLMIEDLINNDVMRAYDQELADKYVFKFHGYDDNTAQTDVALRQAQMTTFASMNDLLVAEGKSKINHKIADVPLNQSFWGLVEKNMTRGEIREFFFGDKDASKRPELQYIPADAGFQAWAQMLVTISAQKKQMKDQAAAQQQQQEQAEHEKQLQLQQEQREQEKHDTEMSTTEDQKAQAAVNYQQSLHESGKLFGATHATHIGGHILKNPMNTEEE